MILLAFAENSIQLVPDGTLLLHVFLILLMVFILNRTLFKPINRILEERDKRTRGRSGQARKILSDVEAKLSAYERALREARAEGYRLMEQERAEAVRERQIKINAIREEISRTVAAEQEFIRAQAEEARATLEGNAYEIAAEISAHILRRPIDQVSAR